MAHRAESEKYPLGITTAPPFSTLYGSDRPNSSLIKFCSDLVFADARMRGIFFSFKSSISFVVFFPYSPVLISTNVPSISVNTTLLDQ